MLRGFKQVNQTSARGESLSHSSAVLPRCRLAAVTPPGLNGANHKPQHRSRGAASRSLAVFVGRRAIKVRRLVRLGQRRRRADREIAA